MRQGRKVKDVADELGVHHATLYRWKRQDRIDRGEAAGTPTEEPAQLRAARRLITELEAELAAVKRATELFSKGRVVRPRELHELVETLAKEGHGTKRVCRLLSVAPSGFFMWGANPPSAREIRRAWLTDTIGAIHETSRGTHGSRRIRAELADAYGQRVNRKLITSIMKDLGVSGLPTRKRRGKPARDKRATTEDLVHRRFARNGPNQLWMTDITEHPTKEGKVYCCCVLDAFSRRVVGWSIDRRPTAAMVNAALGMAIDAPRPPEGGVLHSDHGSQFTSWTFSQRVRAAGLAHSLGPVGDAFDNAVVGSFWGRMQTEMLNRKRWSARVELSTAISDWIEVFYSRTRRHSSLGMMSPVAYEKLFNDNTSAA